MSTTWDMEGNQYIYIILYGQLSQALPTRSTPFGAKFKGALRLICDRKKGYSSPKGLNTEISWGQGESVAAFKMLRSGDLEVSNPGSEMVIIVQNRSSRAWLCREAIHGIQNSRRT